MSVEYRAYYPDIGRTLTSHDIEKAIVRTLPWNQKDFFMVPKHGDVSRAGVILQAIDLNGIICRYETGDIFRIEGNEAFEKAYLTVQEFLTLKRIPHIAEIVKTQAFDI